MEVGDLWWMYIKVYGSLVEAGESFNLHGRGSFHFDSTCFHFRIFHWLPLTSTATLGDIDYLVNPSLVRLRTEYVVRVVTWCLRIRPPVLAIRLSLEANTIHSALARALAATSFGRHRPNFLVTRIKYNAHSSGASAMNPGRSRF